MTNRLVRFLFCVFEGSCLFSNDIHAQDSLQKISLPVYIQGSFFYDFPQSSGAAVGIEFPIKSKNVTHIDSTGKIKSKYHDWIVNGNIGFYRYTFNHTGLFFFPSAGKRYNRGRPYYFEWLATMGVLRTFYDGQVYSVDNNGNVKRLKDYGRFYAVTGFSTVFGHNFGQKKKPKPFSIDVKPSLWFQYPYNSFVLPHFSVELAFKYHFDHLNIRVRQKHIVHEAKK